METAESSRRVVLVVESYLPLRTALAEMLAAELPDVAICQASSAGGALALLNTERPLLAIVEVQTGGEEAFATVRQLRAVQPDLPILALGHAHELPYAQRAASAGAVAYLRKSDPIEALVHATRMVLQDLEAKRGQ